MGLLRYQEIERTQIPKFTIKADTDMIDLCRKNNITTMFDPTRNLDPMIDVATISNDNIGYYVSKLQGRMTVEFDESGVYAKSCTIALIRAETCCGREQEVKILPKFICDHPFYYYGIENIKCGILDKDQYVTLFAGVFTGNYKFIYQTV